MENIELVLREVFIILANAKNTIDEAPAVRCSRKLQGALVKLDELTELLRKDGKIPEKPIVADESSQTDPSPKN